jgi:AcrR family transcriptional regulator
VGTTRRRAPRPEERKLDRDRSCRLLLEAALDEFAEKGYAGARVQSIADRAGVNKQLISYYFGGKKGLFDALQQQWLEEEDELNRPAMTAEELVTWYVQRTLRDPRGTKLLLWSGLTGEGMPGGQDEHSELVRRQAEGEIGADLDPRALLMVMMSMVAAPVLMPDLVRRLFDLEPDSPEFERLWAEQLRRVVRRFS